MKTTQILILVTCQVHENYGQYGSTGKDFWKPAGGKIFQVKVDADIALENQNRLIGVIDKVLQAKSDNKIRYDYIFHEMILDTIEDITPEVMKKFELEFVNMD